MPPAPSPAVRPIQAAAHSETIWSRITQDEFRRHLVTLEEQTNAVPMDVLRTECDGEHRRPTSFLPLPLNLEKQVADDLAYIVAVTEGAQSVAAVCLEQHIDHLVIRVAGMDAINENVKQMLQAVVAELQAPRTESAETIFRLIVEQHQQKLLGRLRSNKWTKPKHLAKTHKKPLWQDFDNLVHRAQHVYPRKPERRVREEIARSIQEICTRYTDFEASDSPNAPALQELVKGTFIWCRSPLIGAYASRLESASQTRQVAAALKTLRQLEKIGAYWRIARDLVGVANQSQSVFRCIDLQYFTPYASVPTSIAYEPWAQTCHVHAEIQLVVDLANSTSHLQQAGCVRPRTIGTSKYLCYLCYLFLRYHGDFQLLNSHGRLYDQWTVPDLAEYSTATRTKFATVLENMDEHVRKQIEETKSVIWRAEPMTSRQSLFLLDTEHDVDTLGCGADKFPPS